jgi:hypothetical protein
MLESESESESSLVSCVSATCDGEPPAGCDNVAACTEPSCEDAPAGDEPLACGIGAEAACDDVAAIDETLPRGTAGLLVVLCFRFLATNLCGFRL